MPEPLLRVTRGTLTEEELAALTAVLLARAAAGAAEPTAQVIRLPRLSTRRPAYHSPVSWLQAA